MSTMTEAGYITHPALAAGELGAVIRYASDGPELVNLRWGLKPAEPGGEPFTAVRAEGRTFESRRCLVPASESVRARAPSAAGSRW
jgi:putative SOS response-associated peptidase YedK